MAKITRDGKTYDLTTAEMRMIWKEHQLNLWRHGIAKAIDRNAPALNFGLDFQCDEFIKACVETAEQYYKEQNDAEHYDEVVLDTAQELGVANEGYRYDDDEEDE